MLNLNYKQFYILQICKNERLSDFTIRELHDILNKRKFLISDPTLRQYLNIFSALGFLTQTKSSLLIFNVNLDYYGWQNITQIIKTIDNKITVECKVLN